MRSDKRGRYPAVLREAVLEYASRAKKLGRSGRAVAVELGVSEQTMSNWRAAADKRGSLAPVTVVAGVGVTQGQGANLEVVEVGDVEEREARRVVAVDGDARHGGPRSLDDVVDVDADGLAVTLGTARMRASSRSYAAR